MLEKVVEVEDRNPELNKDIEIERSKAEENKDFKKLKESERQLKKEVCLLKDQRM